MVEYFSRRHEALYMIVNADKKNYIKITTTNKQIRKKSEREGKHPSCIGYHQVAHMRSTWSLLVSVADTASSLGTFVEHLDFKRSVMNS